MRFRKISLFTLFYLKLHYILGSGMTPMAMGWQMLKKVTWNLAFWLEFNLFLWGVYLAFHGVGVDLAHVGSFVFTLDVGDDQLPRLGTVMPYRNPRIVRDDMSVDRLDGFRIGFDPSDFIAAQVSDVAREYCFVTRGHRHVRQRPVEFRNVAALWTQSNWLRNESWNVTFDKFSLRCHV